jgi:hypothetical protein
VNNAPIITVGGGKKNQASVFRLRLAGQKNQASVFRWLLQAALEPDRTGTFRGFPLTGFHGVAYVEKTGTSGLHVSYKSGRAT